MHIRSILYCVSFLLPAGFTSGQEALSSCSAPDSITKRFKNDADRLAVRRVHRIRSAYKDSISLDKTTSQQYLNALIAVYNATLAASDTVNRLLDIHSYNPGIRKVVVRADSSLFWMHDLRHNVFPTKDAGINRLVSKYHLKQVFYSALFQPNMVVFKTDTNCNLTPLADEFHRMPGVTIAMPDFLYGDGNDITDYMELDYIALTYSYGWEDCAGGCLRKRYWKFKVYGDCTVEYLGSSGNALEPSLFVSVLKNENFFKNITVYPSPVKDKLYIRCFPETKLHVKLTLTGPAGNVVCSVNNLRHDREIDMILLANGAYHLKLESGPKCKEFTISKKSPVVIPRE